MAKPDVLKRPWAPLHPDKNLGRVRGGFDQALTTLRGRFAIALVPKHYGKCEADERQKIQQGTWVGNFPQSSKPRENAELAKRGYSLLKAGLKLT